MLRLLLIYAQLASAAVTIHGPQGDSMTFSSSTFVDADLAGLMALELGSDATLSGTTFSYVDDIACGDDASYAIEEVCLGLPDTAVDCTRSPLSRSRIVPRRSAAALGLSKREYYYCTGAGVPGACSDTIDANQGGGCPAGYERYTVQAGIKQGVICQRACTEEQNKNCLEYACGYRRKQCSMYPASRPICGDALLKCRMDGPVAMRAEACTDEAVAAESKQAGLVPCTGCTSFADGLCTLNNDKFDQFIAADSARVDELAKSYFRFSQD